jgi:hypothetical protein
VSTLPTFHRRTATRHAVTLPCEGVRELGFQRISSDLVDLSRDGAFIATRMFGVEPGEEVWLSFQVPRDGDWMDARARVVRYGREMSRGASVWGLGLRFIEIDRHDRARLSRALAAAPPPVPSRRQPVDYASFVLDIEAEAALTEDITPLSSPTSTTIT